jgi:hypothetical protein
VNYCAFRCAAEIGTKLARSAIDSEKGTPLRSGIVLRRSTMARFLATILTNGSGWKARLIELDCRGLIPMAGVETRADLVSPCRDAPPSPFLIELGEEARIDGDSRPTVLAGL